MPKHGSVNPRKPEGSLGRTAQDGHLDSHTAPELFVLIIIIIIHSFYIALFSVLEQTHCTHVTGDSE